ncbi:hypothetical protein CORC01_01136 [Colletotrichum orchidophilum]|uniref:Uncharacterized protein n=1 Tax=Colletotrichum orchidophilum TaxID=1209926 RepID=A0A1G4BQ61_9PEZI|nr:uncharacterized protein CORC01_01136 [Colletotrichum orchidophilum]OHF03417.1 hypothetical protein CORC01_01136 [Colletotrichum orchidophilum]
MIWEILATVNTEQGDSFFCSFGQLSIRGWAWNDSGAKSVGGATYDSICEHTIGVGVDSDIWFDSNGLGLGNAHPGSWYKHTRRLFFLHTAKKITKNRGLGIGVFLACYLGGSFFPCLPAMGFSTPEVAPQEFFTCLSALDRSWDTRTAGAIMGFRDSLRHGKDRETWPHQDGGFLLGKMRIDHHMGLRWRRNGWTAFSLVFFWHTRSLRMEQQPNEKNIWIWSPPKAVWFLIIRTSPRD